MPKDIITTVYTYAELSDKAKERARDWWREGFEFGFHAESVIENEAEILAALGWTLEKPRGRNAGVSIYYSGFWSQGDGACFTGTWRASDFNDVCVNALLSDRPQLYVRDGKEIRDPGNTALHEYAAHLRECVKAGLQYVETSHSGRYYHEHSVAFDSMEWSEEGTPADATPEQLTAVEDRFKEASREYMREIYAALQREYDYQTSDEAVAESVEANGYTFTEDGRRYG